MSERITIKEASETTGYAVQTIGNWAKQGKIRADKRLVSRHWIWYVDFADVQKLIADYDIPDGYITATDAAKVADVAPQTVTEWCNHGFLKAGQYTPKRVWYVDANDLERFLAIRANNQRKRDNWAGGNGGYLHIPSPDVAQPLTGDWIDDDTKAPQAWRTNYRRGKRSGVYCADIEGKRVGNATAVADFERVHG